MTRGIYFSTMGMLNAWSNLDIISNNLANVDTVGYKRDQIVFKAYLDKYLRSYQVNDFERGIPIGDIEMASVVDKTYTIINQGVLEETQNPYDFAIDGEGFFKVYKNGTILYTRNGQFKRNSEGYLVTNDGAYVLDEDNKYIFVPENFNVDEQGYVYAGNEETGQRLQIVNLSNLYKIGENFFGGKEISAKNYRIKQGFVEKSNVNALKEMVDMINVNRLYNVIERSINAQDVINGRIIEMASRT